MIDSIIGMFIKFLQAIVVVAWSFLIFMIVTVILFHVVNWIQSFFV